MKQDITDIIEHKIVSKNTLEELSEVILEIQKEYRDRGGHCDIAYVGRYPSTMYIRGRYEALLVLRRQNPSLYEVPQPMLSTDALTADDKTTL